jgi:lysophospholipase L1-like esterase
VATNGAPRAPLHDSPRRRLAGPALLALALLAVVAVDRALLASFGLPPWQADPVLHFRHRPHALPIWYPPDAPRFNQHGFFDDEFARAKPAGELRIVAIGDSVVMGYGVAMAAAFPNRLEALLADGASGFRSYQVINAGVQGYWTAQYPEVLRRALELSPDAVLLGFCLNDVTAIGRDVVAGGGLEMFGIYPTADPLLSYLANETCFGRLAAWLRSDPAQVTAARRREADGVHRLVANDAGDRALADVWRQALRDHGAVYDLAARHRLPVVLLVFPFDFQIGHPELQEPQRIVARYASTRGVPVLDVTPLFEHAVRQGATTADLFLDGAHFSARGHALVAAALLELLEQQQLIRPGRAGLR